MGNCPIYLPGEVPPSMIISLNNKVSSPYSTSDKNLLLIDPTVNYAKSEIINLTVKLNSILKSNDITNYPYISSRINRNFDKFDDYIGNTVNYNLSYLEVAQFINDYGYSITDLEIAINSYDALNGIDDSSSFGSFLSDYDNSLGSNKGCAIPTNIFGVLDNLFSKVSDAMGRLKEGFDLLSGMINNFQQLIQGGIFDLINNAISGLIQQFMAKLQSLMSGLTDFIDCLFNSYSAIMHNLSTKTAQFMHDAKSLSGGAFNFLGGELNKLQRTFSETDIKTLKENSKKQLDATLSQFEVVGDDVTEFVGARFTQYLTQVKHYMDSRIGQYNELLNNSVTAYKDVVTLGQKNAINSVMYGAKAFKEDAVAEMRENLSMAGITKSFEKYGFPSV